MKTIAFVIFFGLAAFTTFAQSRVQWGFLAGGNLSDFAASGSDFSNIRTETHPVYGFQAGLTAELAIVKILRLRTGLQVERRGFAFEINQSVIHYEALYRPYYLQIPAILALTNGHLHFGIGPYLAYGVGGNYHSEWAAPGASIILPEPQNRKLKWGNNAAEDDFSPLDAGLQFEAGLTVRPFRLSGAYELGLTNIQPHPDAAGVVKKSRVFSLSLHYFLGRI